MWKIFVFATLLITAVFCESDSVEESDQKPGYCHTNGLDIKEGDAVPAPIGKCVELKCLEAPHNVILSLNCVQLTLSPESKCHASEIDLTKTYPQCCPRAVCPEDE